MLNNFPTMLNKLLIMLNKFPIMLLSHTYSAQVPQISTETQQATSVLG